MVNTHIKRKHKNSQVHRIKTGNRHAWCTVVGSQANKKLINWPERHESPAKQEDYVHPSTGEDCVESIILPKLFTISSSILCCRCVLDDVHLISEPDVSEAVDEICHEYLKALDVVGLSC